jgi:hypothetical protein
MIHLEITTEVNEKQSLGVQPILNVAPSELNQKQFYRTVAPLSEPKTSCNLYMQAHAFRSLYMHVSNSARR